MVERNRNAVERGKKTFLVACRSPRPTCRTAILVTNPSCTLRQEGVMRKHLASLALIAFFGGAANAADILPGPMPQAMPEPMP